FAVDLDGDAALGQVLRFEQGGQGGVVGQGQRLPVELDVHAAIVAACRRARIRHAAVHLERAGVFVEPCRTIRRSMLAAAHPRRSCKWRCCPAPCVTPWPPPWRLPPLPPSHRATVPTATPCSSATA